MVPSRGRMRELVPPGRNLKVKKEEWGGGLNYKKGRKAGTPAVPSQRKRSLEVIRRRLKGVVGGKFIDSLYGIDELWDRKRSLKVRDPLSLHDVLD